MVWSKEFNHRKLCYYYSLALSLTILHPHTAVGSQRSGFYTNRDKRTPVKSVDFKESAIKCPAKFRVHKCPRTSCTSYINTIAHCDKEKRGKQPDRTRIKFLERKPPWCDSLHLAVLLNPIEPCFSWTSIFSSTPHSEYCPMRWTTTTRRSARRVQVSCFNNLTFTQPPAPIKGEVVHFNSCKPKNALPTVRRSQYEVRGLTMFIGVSACWKYMLTKNVKPFSPSSLWYSFLNHDLSLLQSSVRSLR